MNKASKNRDYPLPKYVLGQVLGLTLRGKLVGVEVILDVYKGVYTLLTAYGGIIKVKVRVYDNWPIQLVKPLTQAETILFANNLDSPALKGVKLVFKDDPIPNHTPTGKKRT